MSEEKKIVRSVGVPHKAYAKLMDELKRGKKAYVLDREGKPDEVELRNGEIWEISTNRQVVDIEAMKAEHESEMVAVSTHGKLIMAYGDPVLTRGPLAFFHNKTTGTFLLFDGRLDRVIGEVSAP